MSYQIIRLTVLSTIKLCFPDSKLYLCMCRVIFLSVVNVESWPHQILCLTVLSTNRVILLWILRPTVLSTIYQVMLVVIICGLYV